MNRRIFLAASSVFILLFSFQNCGLANSSHRELNSLGKTCLATAQRAFNDTYYPHLRSQCSQCHDNGGAGISWFASADQQFAFTAFMNTTREKLNSMMVYDGHPGPSNGLSQQSFVDSMAAQWTTLDKQIDDCVNASAVTTVPKNTSVQDITINDANDSNKRPWKTLEYDLYTDLDKAQNNGVIKMVVRVQYRESGPGTLNGNIREYNSDIGYEFRAPSARIRAGAEAGTQYSVDKVNILMNGRKISSVTSFEAIQDVVVGLPADTPLQVTAASPGIVTKNPAIDQFQMRFAEVRDANGRTIGGDGGGNTIPARVTYVELAASANQYGYFARNCFSCHQGASPAAGLNLTTFASAQAASGRVRSRVNDAMRPMPPGGLLPQFDRDVITKWADIGAPQN